MHIQETKELDVIDQIPVLVVTVTTADGANTTHNYVASGSIEKVKPIISRIMSNVRKAVSGKRAHLMLVNPIVMYKSSYIVRVCFEAKGAEELLKDIEEHKGPIGFRR